MSTNPGGRQYPGVPESPSSGHRKSHRSRIMVVGPVAAAAGRGRRRRAGATMATTVTTVTSTPAPVTATADPTTVTAAPVSVTATATATDAASGPAATIKNGINLVGVDVQPGTYRSEKDDCYWARLSGTGGDFGDTITNSIGATVVTIEQSDVAFESRSCAPWTQVG